MTGVLLIIVVKSNYGDTIHRPSRWAGPWFVPSFVHSISKVASTAPSQVSKAVINQEHSLLVEGKICLLLRMAGRVLAHSHGTEEQGQRLSEEGSLKIHLLWQAYLLMAVTGIGYLALTCMVDGSPPWWLRQHAGEEGLLVPHNH
jgi:hypothetical protein